jgi:hypothetical protein
MFEQQIIYLLIECCNTTTHYWTLKKIHAMSKETASELINDMKPIIEWVSFRLIIFSLRTQQVQSCC